MVAAVLWIGPNQWLLQLHSDGSNKVHSWKQCMRESCTSDNSFTHWVSVLCFAYSGFELKLEDVESRYTCSSSWRRTSKRCGIALAIRTKFTFRSAILQPANKKDSRSCANRNLYFLLYNLLILFRNTSYLVDPASSHMLVSKIKPCKSQYKHLYCETAESSLYQL